MTDFTFAPMAEIKYRRLSSDELEEMQKEFIEFLIVNGITADDWEKLKVDSKEKAENLLDLFSNLVFEKIMSEVKYLDFNTDTKRFSFQCTAANITLIGSELLDGKSHVFTQQKKYSKERELEIFEMIQNGCVIANKDQFNQLALSLAESEIAK